MPLNGTYWLGGGLLGIFSLLFGSLTRRVNGMCKDLSGCRAEHGQRLATLETHYIHLKEGQGELKQGQRQIVEKLDAFLGRGDGSLSA